MFERKHSQDKDRSPAGASPVRPAVRDPQAPKGHATPTRREREEARKRPLVAPDAPRGAKGGQSGRDQRAYARQQMLAGNEKFLSERDRGPERALLRDAVDSRWNLGEFFLPFALLFLLLTFIRTPWAQVTSVTLVWALMLATIVDGYLCWRRAKKLCVQRLGHAPGKGAAWYAVLRGMQMRRMRMPLPRVRRGQSI